LGYDFKKQRILKKIRGRKSGQVMTGPPTRAVPRERCVCVRGAGLGVGSGGHTAGGCRVHRGTACHRHGGAVLRRCLLPRSTERRRRM